MIQKENVPLLAEYDDAQAVRLCQELRETLIADVSQTGGHLASNLGAVELTVAIHRVFDTRRDRLVFDVGHQCYIHKMLTGRAGKMTTIRQFGGLSGFPNPNESANDAFIAGHASNSVAVAVGMARARTLLKQEYHVLALMGDGSLTGGLAYEGLSNAGASQEPMIVILNDNGMSIAPNVGGVAQHLAHQRLKPQYISIKKWYRRVTSKTWIGRKLYRLTHGLKKAFKESLLPSSLFENMGFYYMGPVDGHDVARLTRVLRYAKELKEPVLLHVRTVKGKGFLPAEQSPDMFHGIGAFDPQTGQPRQSGGRGFSAVFGEKLVALAQKDRRICAITAAMPAGTGLDQFRELFPNRYFDVGIAEGCAVSMAAGMARQGVIPVVAIYSTFLQRAYDMLIHDIAIQRLHVVLCVDRAGLVGEDGETHQGLFDLAYLSTIPNMTILAPSSFAELEGMLEYAIFQVDGPVAVRYPRGGESGYSGLSGGRKAVMLRTGCDLTLVGYGSMISSCLTAADMLAQHGIQAEVLKFNVLAPMDAEAVIRSVQKTGALLVAEDCIERGSIGEQICAVLEEQGISAKIALCNTGDRFIPHGSVAQLRLMLGLDGASLCRRGLEMLQRA